MAALRMPCKVSNQRDAIPSLQACPKMELPPNAAQSD